MGIHHGELLATMWVGFLLWIVHLEGDSSSIVPSLVPRLPCSCSLNQFWFPGFPHFFVLWLGFSFVMEVTAVPHVYVANLPVGESTATYWTIKF